MVGATVGSMMAVGLHNFVRTVMKVGVYDMNVPHAK